MIAVIGAGPAGCYYASRVTGGEVHIFEDHDDVGTPVACTGIVTDSVRGVIGDIPAQLIISRITRFKLVAPSGGCLYVNLDKVNQVLDRPAFDRHLRDQALANGATLHRGERFLGYEKRGRSYLIRTTRDRYRADMIVGADGPESAVARAAGIYGNRRFVRGWQSRCEYDGLEKDVSEIRLTLGEFSWIVPETDRIARVGVIGPDTPGLENDFRTLMGGAKTIEDQSGLIPVFDPHQLVRKPGENIFLIGDAATQVKATTYGGIIYGLIAAQYLAEDPETFVHRLNGKVRTDLWLSLRMRDLMNRMTESQANELIDIFEKQENRRIIERHDRDFPSKFIVRLLMKETRLWKLGFDLLRGAPR
jgi:digeranylgeranylglycerophospholipid reductase